MTRRTLVLAIPQVMVQPLDQWQELAKVWNPFAESMNRGELNLKSWKKVVAAVERIEGRKCK